MGGGGGVELRLLDLRGKFRCNVEMTDERVGGGGRNMLGKVDDVEKHRSQ